MRELETRNQNAETRRATLSWRSAAKIAWRDMRSSTGKFLFVALSVAIGVAALTGVRGFSGAFRQALLLNARSIMAADISARMFQQPTPAEQAQLDAMRKQGMEMTSVTEMVSMASTPANPNPLLVSLKAVNPAQYPFYGKVTVQPAGSLSSLLTDGTVVVGDDLLMRLHTQVGEQLKIGGRLFRIAGVVVSEPDRLSSSMGLGPRVLMTQHALEQTDLLQPGSRSAQRYLFKLPADQRDAVDSVKAKIEQMLPEAQVTDFRETNPALTEGLDRSTSMLSLMSLVAMVLGALGVAMAMRAHLQQRLDTIAIMKSMGARSSQILRIYLLQTLLLGIAGGLLGVMLGVGVQSAFPLLLKKYIALQPDMHLQLRAILTGIGTGILTTLLFTLPPLLDIRNVRPSLIFRRAVDEGEAPDTEKRWSFWLGKLAKHRAQLLAMLLILAGLAAIATTLSDSATVGKWFAVGLLAALIALLGMSAALLRGLRWFLAKTRLHLPSQVRHGLANLYRPGNQSAAVLAALGTGVMLILTVFLMQQAVVGELNLTASPDIPNVFLVDISARELDGVVKLMEQQPGLRGPVETLPVVSARLLSIDGVPTEKLRLEHYPRRMLQSTSLSWADQLPKGTKVLHGAWWQAGSTAPQIAVNDRTAQRLHLHLGSHMVFSANDREIAVTVVALTKSDGQHAYSRSSFIVPQSLLSGFPTIWYGAVHIDPAQVATAQRALYAAYPTITVINVADALETIRGVVMQIALVVQFLAVFSIFAGIIILASSIAGTRYRRTREVVVLKTLGATRMRIASVFSVEFLVLGVVAGTVGVIFANLLTHVLLKRMDVRFHFNWIALVAGILGTALIADVTGWLASYRILGQKPLEVLREE
ncbi:MAG: ABC transporter permease [Acidobacteriaceae bacterium]